MPSFTFIGDSTRLFPTLTLTVEPGDVVEFDSNPDTRWFTESAVAVSVFDSPDTPKVDQE
jgi:hypothetical protein